jgi:hypothetical protein
MTTRIEVQGDQFLMPDLRLARRATVYDELGNPANVIVAYNGPPTCGGENWIEVYATEAWVIEEVVNTDLDDLLLIAAFDRRAKTDA